MKNANIQKIAIKQLLKDRNTHLLHKLNSTYFTKAYKTIYNLIESYYDNKSKLPEKDDLISLFESKLSKEKAETYTAIIKSLDKVQSNMTDDEVVEELRKNKLLVDVESKLQDLVNAGENKDTEKLMSLIGELNNKVSSIENGYIPDDVKDVEFKNVNLASVESCLSTLRDNGVNLSALTLLGGSSGGGKTNLALQQALYSYNQGLNVAFLSLEVDNSLLLARMCSQATNTLFSDIMKNPNKKEIIDNWKSEYFDRPNKFLIKYARYSGEQVKSVVKQLAKQGIQLIVIDYLGLVQFENSNDEWRNMSNLVKDLHSLAVELGVVILTPTQINIEESKSGNIHITTRNSKELIFSSSLFLVIHQNEEEKQENCARIIVEKARNSQKIAFMVRTNFDTLSFEDLGIVV